METLLIILLTLVCFILLSGLVTWGIITYQAFKIKKRAEKFLTEKGVETAVKITKKILDKK